MTSKLELGAASALTLVLGLALCEPAVAQNLLSLNTAPARDGGQTWSVPVQTLLTLTALSFVPAMLLLVTSFTRIIIVLSLLRHALGTQSSPPTQVLVGLALFLTLFVMNPVFERIYQDAYLPLSEQKIDFSQAIDKALPTLKTFMLKQTRQADLALFMKMANVPEAGGPDEVPFRVIVPAFVTSELKTAFQIGFMIFIPFLIIDLVVASVLMSMGMMMLSPVLISLPFKLMLFVLVDGWNLLLGSLAGSFGT